MTFPTAGTWLSIKRRSDNVVLLPPYSSRDLTQTLEPIQEYGQFTRTMNGKLLDLTNPTFFRYRSVITCTDFRPPALDSLSLGLPVTVDCVAELSYRTGDAATRSVVSGSNRTEGSYHFYRPSLNMYIIAFTHSKNEYPATVPWSITLEEDGNA